LKVERKSGGRRKKRSRVTLVLSRRWVRYVLAAAGIVVLAGAAVAAYF
jgi:hypothetical protein